MRKRLCYDTSMNRLSLDLRVQVLAALCEGSSIRATCRMTGVAKNTIQKLLHDVGTACDAYQDRSMRDLKCRRIQADEIWSFCYSKERNVPERFADKPGYGSVYTWVALDEDTKTRPVLAGRRPQLYLRPRVHPRSSQPHGASYPAFNRWAEALYRGGRRRLRLRGGLRSAYQDLRRRSPRAAALQPAELHRH